ncbi:MAG: 50S ribosomal protein L31e [Candidatus Altiarchaeota archaeon]
MKKKEKTQKEDERVYMVPLGNAFQTPKTRRARKAINMIREFLKRHTKTENIKIDASLNEKIWERGIKKPPRRIKVKVIKKDTETIASLAE